MLKCPLNPPKGEVDDVLLGINILNSNSIQQKPFEQIELIKPLKQEFLFGVYCLLLSICILNQSAILQKPFERIEPFGPLKHEFVFDVWSLRSFDVFCLWFIV